LLHENQAAILYAHREANETNYFFEHCLRLLNSALNKIENPKQNSLTDAKENLELGIKVVTKIRDDHFEKIYKELNKLDNLRKRFDAEYRRCPPYEESQQKLFFALQNNLDDLADTLKLTGYFSNKKEEFNIEQIKSSINLAQNNLNAALVTLSEAIIEAEADAKIKAQMRQKEAQIEAQKLKEQKLKEQKKMTNLENQRYKYISTVKICLDNLSATLDLANSFNEFAEDKHTKEAFNCLNLAEENTRKAFAWLVQMSKENKEEDKNV